jgi:hypothetical protein
MAIANVYTCRPAVTIASMDCPPTPIGSLHSTEEADCHSVTGHAVAPILAICDAEIPCTPIIVMLVPPIVGALK